MGLHIITLKDGTTKKVSKKEYEKHIKKTNADWDKIKARKKELGSALEQLEYIVEHGIDAFISKQKAINEKYSKG